MIDKLQTQIFFKQSKQLKQFDRISNASLKFSIQMKPSVFPHQLLNYPFLLFHLSWWGSSVKFHLSWWFVQDFDIKSSWFKIAYSRMKLHNVTTNVFPFTSFCKNLYFSCIVGLRTECFMADYHNLDYLEES